MTTAQKRSVAILFGAAALVALAASLLVFISDLDPTDHHGTPAERYDEFMKGFNTADIENYLGNR